MYRSPISSSVSVGRTMMTAGSGAVGSCDCDCGRLIRGTDETEDEATLATSLGTPALSVKVCAEDESVKVKRSKPARNATKLRFMANLLFTPEAVCPSPDPSSCPRRYQKSSLKGSFSFRRSWRLRHRIGRRPDRLRRWRLWACRRPWSAEPWAGRHRKCGTASCRKCRQYCGRRGGRKTQWGRNRPRRLPGA